MPEASLNEITIEENNVSIAAERNLHRGARPEHFSSEFQRGKRGEISASAGRNKGKSHENDA